MLDLCGRSSNRADVQQIGINLPSFPERSSALSGLLIQASARSKRGQLFGKLYVFPVRASLGAKKFNGVIFQNATMGTNFPVSEGLSMSEPPVK